MVTKYRTIVAALLTVALIGGGAAYALNQPHPDHIQSFTEAVNRGYIDGDPAYYYNGEATPQEYAHAVMTALINYEDKWLNPTTTTTTLAPTTTSSTTTSTSIPSTTTTSTTTTPSTTTVPPTTTSTTEPPSSSPDWIVGEKWQWVLTGDTVDIVPGATVYDFDGNDHPASTVAALQATGAKTICYVSAGSWEDWRPDADQYPDEVKGRNNGWPGEKYVDIRQWETLGPILDARTAECADKGFDAMEYDNVDTYTANTGFPLTASDQITFNRRLADMAHSRGLDVALKNNVDQLAELEPYFDFAINEECLEWDECSEYSVFLDNDKPVYHAEYRGTIGDICDSVPVGFSTVKKRLDLGNWAEYCTGGAEPVTGTLRIGSGESNTTFAGLNVANPDGPCIVIEGAANVTIQNSTIGPCGHWPDINAKGIYALNSTNIHIVNNEFVGEMRNAVQFDKVQGGTVLNNVGSWPIGESFAEDLINLYQSHGTEAAPILVDGNQMSGGGPSNSGTCILLGDGGGSWQVASNNTCLNPGQVGIAVAGGQHMLIANNFIRSVSYPWSNVGMYVWDQYDSSCSDVTVSGNDVEWYNSSGVRNDFWDGGNC